MFSIYISSSIYQTIISAEEHADDSSRSSLCSLLKQQQVLLLSAEATNQLKEKPENVLKSPSSLFILDITPAEASYIQGAYGVMCLSGENPDVSALIDVNDVHISNEHEKLGRGWDSVLDSVEKLPSNALLLTDRYLFTSRHPNAGDGIENIHDILDELLPLHFFGDEYHVTVIFDKQSKHSSYTFNEIATRLNRLKLQLNRDYPIMMEVLGISPDCSLYKKLHNRLIVSNYYLVEAGHKLAAFNKNMATARQTLLPMALFTEGSLRGTSTPPMKAIEQTVAAVREFSESLSKLVDHKVYSYAVNGRCMEPCLGIRNRLTM